MEPDFGMPLHPEADKLTVPSWDEPGQCICGHPLPPVQEWNDAHHQWSNITCAECGRCYVEEDEFLAIYDEGCDQDGDA